jgi:hypothetical protein
MKNKSTIFIIILCFISFNLSSYAGESKKPLYTAYNIWKYDSEPYMYCINYKSTNEIIPAGTLVYNARVHVNDDSKLVSKSIKFRLVATDEKIRIRFRKRWHPGKSIEDYFNKMFTTVSFIELTKDFSDKEIDAIKKGKIVNGMSKRAVITAFGYPPEHKTQSLENDQWIYWITTVGKKVICFDNDNRTTDCGY